MNTVPTNKYIYFLADKNSEPQQRQHSHLTPRQQTDILKKKDQLFFIFILSSKNVYSMYVVVPLKCGNPTTANRQPSDAHQSRYDTNLFIFYSHHSHYKYGSIHVCMYVCMSTKSFFCHFLTTKTSFFGRDISKQFLALRVLVSHAGWETQIVVAIVVLVVAFIVVVIVAIGFFCCIAPVCQLGVTKFHIYSILAHNRSAYKTFGVCLHA